jgi:hypothetical protein
MSKIDHAPIAEQGHTRMMALQANMLTREQFASLLVIGNTRAVSDPPAIIPADHRIMLIALGYMADLEGRLRMTTPGRSRIAAGFENRPLLDRD